MVLFVHRTDKVNIECLEGTRGEVNECALIAHPAAAAVYATMPILRRRPHGAKVQRPLAGFRLTTAGAGYGGPHKGPLESLARRRDAAVVLDMNLAKRKSWLHFPLAMDGHGRLFPAIWRVNSVTMLTNYLSFKPPKTANQHRFFSVLPPGTI